MRVLVNKAPFARVIRDGAHEIQLESGPNLVSDETLEIAAVARLLQRGLLREQPLPSADREWNGGDLPDDSATLNEASALRAIVAARSDDVLLLRRWLDSEARPNLRSAIERALTNLTLSVPGNLLRD